MTSNSLSLELLPMDVPADSPKPPLPAEPAAPAEIEIAPLSEKRAAPPDAAAPDAAKPDRFLREAANQYTEGHLDQPLWDRALAQANGDKEAAVASYLQARAIALRLLDRERRSKRRANAAEAVRNELDEATEQEDFPVGDLARVKRRFAITRYRNALIGGGVLLLLLIGWALYSFLNANSPADNYSGVSSGRTPAAARAPAAPAKAAPAVKPKQVASAELMQKIQDLRDAQNWNVLVFYLVEWTRVEPGNPEAWDQLRADYLNLKQYDDALNAAKQAKELAPKDPRMWRNLGRVQQSIDDMPGAIRSFEQAVALDDADAVSLREIGILNAQLGRLPEAKTAFDRAVTIKPDDAPAVCMRAAVAQLSPAPQDAYTTGKRAREIDKRCRGF